MIFKVHKHEVSIGRNNNRHNFHKQISPRPFRIRETYVLSLFISKQGVYLHFYSLFSDISIKNADIHQFDIASGTVEKLLDRLLRRATSIKMIIDVN